MKTISIQKKVFVVLCLMNISFLYGQENYIDEYKLLYTDLLNYKTFGYKSYFNRNINKATKSILFEQSTLTLIDAKDPILSFAILGGGFFKIRLENGVIGYTRSGDFKINENNELVTEEGYSLYESIFFDNSVLHLKIDNNIIYSDSSGQRKEYGYLYTYSVPVENLTHYKNAIYVLSAGDEQKIEKENRIINNTVEFSNVMVLPILARMYYILNNITETDCNNLVLKKEYITMLLTTLPTIGIFTDIQLKMLTYNDTINSIFHLLDTELFPEKQKGKMTFGGMEIIGVLGEDGISYTLSEWRRLRLRAGISTYEINQLFQSRYYLLDTLLPYINIE